MSEFLPTIEMLGRWAPIADRVVTGVRIADSAASWSSLAEDQGTRLSVSRVPTLYVDGTEIDVKLDPYRRVNGDGFARVLLPWGADEIEARFAVKFAVGYTLRDPENAPRRLPENLTPAEYEALTETERDEDGDETPVRYRYETRWAAGDDHVVRLAVPASLGERLTFGDVGSIEEMPDALLADWRPDPVYVEVFGSVFGPWLPGSLAYREPLLAWLAEQGYRSGYSSRKIGIRVHYDPPLTARRKIEYRGRRPKNGPTHENVAQWRTVEVEVDVPERYLHTSLGAAVKHRERRFAEWLDYLVSVGEWRTCSHCSGAGVVFVTRKSPAGKPATDQGPAL